MRYKNLKPILGVAVALIIFTFGILKKKPKNENAEADEPESIFSGDDKKDVQQDAIDEKKRLMKEMASRGGKKSAEVRRAKKEKKQ